MVPSYGNPTTNLRCKMIDSEMIVKLTFNRSLDLLRKIDQQNVPVVKEKRTPESCKIQLG